MARIPQSRLPAAADEHDGKLLADVQEYGWHVLQIMADDDRPAFAYSVGLYRVRSDSPRSSSAGSAST